MLLFKDIGYRVDSTLKSDSSIVYHCGDAYTFNLDNVRIPSKYPEKKHYKGKKKGLLSGNPAGKNPSDFWTFLSREWNEGVWGQDPAIFLFECITLGERKSLSKEIRKLEEIEFESSVNLADPTSGFSFSAGVNKIRKLNRSIGDSLKRLYEDKC